MHPEDFDRLTDIEAFVQQAAALPEIKLSPAAIEAHTAESTPVAPTEDPKVLDKLFGGRRRSRR